MAGPPGDQTRPELQKNPEKYSHYDRVVLGHPFSSIDRDQIIAAYFAYKLGYVNVNADYIATGDVSDELLNNPNNLVFEGFRQRRFEGEFNKKQGNKFHNSLDSDGTAASSFLNAKQNLSHPQWQDFAEIRSWLNAKDANKSLPKTDRLSLENLNVLDTLFHGFKKDMIDSGEVDLKKYMDQCFEVLDKTIEYAKSGKTLEQDYPKVDSHYRKQREQTLQEIEKLTDDPNIFQYDPEKKVAFLSCTSFEDPIEIGGPGTVKKKVKEKFGEEPEVIVIFNNEHNEAGVVTGTKVYIDYNNYPGENLEDLLEHRLNYLESLFGQGFDTATRRGFGGHRYHVLASPQFLGTKLDENAVHYLLEDFFDKPRYTEKTFAEKSTQFVSLLGDVEQYAPIKISSPEDQWAVPERVLEINIKNQDGHLQRVLLTESEIPLYESLLNKIPLEDRQKWLLQKTEFGEHKEVIAEREKLALISLEKHLSEDKPLKLLQDINGINSASIRKLSPDIRLQILNHLSARPDTISKVYNLQDTQYRVLIKYLPNWLKENPAEHIAARYNYESLPKKIDTTLITSLCDTALDKKDPSIQFQVAKALTSILNSETYIASHKSESFDHLLENILEFAVDPRLNSEVAKELVARVKAYSTKSPSHLIQISQTYPSLLRRAAQLDPELIKTLQTINIDLEKLANDDYIEGVPRSRVTKPDYEQIKSRSDHTTTILVDIGRNTERDLSIAGFMPWKAKDVVPHPGVDGRVVIRGSIDGTRNFESPDHIQLVAQEVVNMVLETAKQINGPEDKIQLVLSSGPNQLVLDIATQLTMACAFGRKLSALQLANMTVIRFNMQTNEYEEVEFIRSEASKEWLAEQSSN